MCILICSSKLLLSLQAFSHSGHIKFEVLVCVVMCALKVDRRPKDFWQYLHSKLRSPVCVTKKKERISILTAILTDEIPVPKCSGGGVTFF